MSYYVSYPLSLINAHTDLHGKPHPVEESQCLRAVQAALQRDDNHCVGVITCHMPCHMHIYTGTPEQLSTNVTHTRDSKTSKTDQRAQKKPCDRTIDSVGNVSPEQRGGTEIGSV